MANDEKRPLKVFLCHASGDKPPVRDLYKRLTVEGVDAWLDKEKLLPGQDWRLEIPRAVKEADVVVVCLSNKSVTKEGYVQKEIKFALDSAEEKPEGAIFLIPARLEDCAVPERLSRWQWVDLYEENGFFQLLRSLKMRADAVGATVEPTSYIDSDKETESRLEQLYTEGLAAFYTEDWDRACHRFQSILNERPNHKNATEKLAEADRQRNLSKLYAQASESVRSEDWGIAIQTLEELTQKSAEYKDAASLLRNARKQKQLRELYAEAGKLHAAQKWQAVVKVFEQISAIEPNYPDPNGLLPSAQKEVAELQRLAELNHQYSQGVREMDSGNWVEARRLLEWVHKSQTGFLETEKLLRKVEVEILREDEKRRQNDQVNTLYEQAHGLLRSKKWRNALEKMEEIRKLDEHFPDADGIAEKAQKELTREEQEAERQNKLAALYAEAVRLLKEEKYQEALDKWQEVKAIDSKYPDRQGVGRTVKRKLAGVRKPIVMRNDWKSKLGGVFSGKEAKPSTGVQTYAGWLVLFVAASWGIGRFAIEMLARVTNFFGNGVGFWPTEIILGTFGLIYGLAIWLMLRFLRVKIDSKKAILFLVGWLAGFVLVPVIGWNFSDVTDQAWNIGYVLAGLIAGLATALVLLSIGAIPSVRQVLIITVAIILSIYIGEKVSGALIVDIFSPGASYPLAFGSIMAGVFSASILECQLSKKDDEVNFAEKRCLILLAALGFGLGRLVELNLTRVFRVDIPGELTWAVGGALQGLFAALVLGRLVREWRWKSLPIFGLCWAVVYPMVLWAFREGAMLLIASMVFSLAPAVSIVLSSVWTRRVMQWQTYVLIFIGWILAWVIGLSLADYINPVLHGSSLRWVLRDILVGGMGVWITIDLLKSGFAEKTLETVLGEDEKTSGTTKLLLMASLSIVVFRAVWGFLQNWFHIWSGKSPSFIQIAFYAVLGGFYGFVVAYALRKVVRNWKIQNSLTIIIGWALGLVGALVAGMVNLEFIAVVMALCGLSVVVAIAWANPSVSPVKLTLIFLCWALAWKYGNLLGSYLKTNLATDYTWCYADAITLLLGLLGTLGIYEYSSNRLVKTTLIAAIGFAAGNFIGTVLIKPLDSQIGVPLGLVIWGFIAGAIFEIPSRNLKKILIKGGLCAFGLVIGYFSGLLFASRYTNLPKLLWGLSVGIALSLSTRRISVITLIAILGPAIFLMTVGSISGIDMRNLWGNAVRGAWIGLVLGFGYAYATIETRNSNSHNFSVGA